MTSQTHSNKSQISTSAPFRLDSPALKDVGVSVVARLGEVEMTLGALLALKRGDVLTIDRQMNEPIDLLLNDQVIARGTIVAVDDRFGVRIDEVAQQG